MTINAARLTVFEVGEHDWFIASSAEEALAEMESLTGADHLTIEDVKQITVEDMQGMTYYEDIYNRTGERSFLEQVGRLILDNEWKPGIFATSDI